MGGKVFALESGYNPAERIPEESLAELNKQVLAEFSYIFEKIQMSSGNKLGKKDHGDIDFVVIKKENSHDMLNTHCIEHKYSLKTNGPMKHVLYKFSNKYHQIDFIFANDEIEFDTLIHFYSCPVVFNAVIGHFARSIGYKFSTMGFFIDLKDPKKQKRKFCITRDLNKAYEILMVKNPDTIDNLYESPERFAQWIMDSPRFDSELFQHGYNRQAHRDSYTDLFCGDVYRILHNSKIVATVPNSIIDFTVCNDYREMLQRDIDIVGHDFYDELMECVMNWGKVKKTIITGEKLIQLGYKPGKLFGEIIADCAKKFSLDSDEEDVVQYVLSRYPVDTRFSMGCDIIRPIGEKIFHGNSEGISALELMDEFGKNFKNENQD